MLEIAFDEPLAAETVKAIRTGDIEHLEILVREHPSLAAVRIVGTDSECGSDRSFRTLLHVATDWPGNFPNIALTVSLLVEYGADVNARFVGAHSETPLHWAASSDDVDALDALLDCGADIEAKGGVIGGGTPLADAVAFGQWRAARRLIERGARTTLWQAAALGLTDRMKEHLAGSTEPGEVTRAFWCACHGGQQAAAEFLLDRGADINWIGYDSITPLQAAERTGVEALVAWLRRRGAMPANELG